MKHISHFLKKYRMFQLMDNVEVIDSGRIGTVVGFDTDHDGERLVEIFWVNLNGEKFRQLVKQDNLRMV